MMVMMISLEGLSWGLNTPSKYSPNDGYVYTGHNTTTTQPGELPFKRLTDIIHLRSIWKIDNRRLNTRLLILIIEENTPSLFNRSVYFPLLKPELSNNIISISFSSSLLDHCNSLLFHYLKTIFTPLLDILRKWKWYNYAILNNLKYHVPYHLSICIVYYSVCMAIRCQHTVWSFNTEPLTMWGSEMMYINDIF